MWRLVIKLLMLFERTADQRGANFEIHSEISTVQKNRGQVQEINNNPSCSQSPNLNERLIKMLITIY